MTMDSAADGIGLRPDTERELRVAVQKLARRIRAERSGRISDLQLGLLLFLDHSGPHTPGQLADRERVTPQSMNRTLNSLADAGYITRSRSEQDGRCVIIAITDAGRDHAQEVRRRRNEWVGERLAELTGEERALLVTATPVLRRLADA